MPSSQDIARVMAEMDRFNQTAKMTVTEERYEKRVASVGGSYGGLTALLQQGAPGNWASDHKSEAEKFAGWHYVAISSIGKAVRSANCEAYQEKVREYAKAYNEQDDDSEPLPKHHPLIQLLKRPNPSQSGASFREEVAIQLCLTGSALIWNVPNQMGRTVERYVIPTAIAEPRQPERGRPKGGWYINPEVARWQIESGWFLYTGLATAIGKVIDARDVQVVRFIHPVFKDEGQSPVSAGALWTDTSEKVDISRHSHLRNGSDPSVIIGIDGVEDEGTLQRMSAKFNEKYAGPSKHGKAMFVNGQNVKVEPVTRTPAEMAYEGAFVQFRDAIMALHGVTPIAAGIEAPSGDDGLYAPLKQFISGTVQPILDLMAEEDTEQLAGQFGEGISVLYTAKAIDDAKLTEQQINTDIAAGAIEVDEIRKLRGRKPWGGEKGKAVAGQGAKEEAKPGLPGLAQGVPGLETKPNGLEPQAVSQSLDPGKPPQGTPDPMKLAEEAVAKALGGFADRLSALLKTGDNCGTGAGGFKPGNDCAGGEGGNTEDEYKDRLFRVGKKIRNREQVSEAELSSLNPEDRAAMERLRSEYKPRSAKPKEELKVVKKYKNGVEVVDGKFSATDEPDEYLYHVTTKERASKIGKDGFIADKARSMGSGFYEQYSKGKVFFADRNGVSYWQGKISDHLESQTDGEAPKLVVLRVPKASVSGLEKDDLGTKDSRAGAYFVRGGVKLKSFFKSSDCGANAEGGGGFQPGNTCGKRDGKDSSESAEGGGKDATVNPKILAWAREKFGDDTTAENFAKWFGDSKVVDEEGNPLTVYHGTRRSSGGKIGQGGFAVNSVGVVSAFFDMDAERADGYAVSFDESFNERKDGVIIPAFLAIKNPKVFKSEYNFELDAKSIKKARDEGYDGYSASGRVFLPFSPTQIKSATGNSGTFDPKDPNITKSGSGCGANAEGGGGFQRGNTCGSREGGDSEGSGGSKQGKGGKVYEWALKKFKDEETARNFTKWFGDSKMVDSEGNPVIVYHGSPNGQFREFKLDKAGDRTDYGNLGIGIYTTPSKFVAEAYAGRTGDVMPLYLKSENPITILYDENFKANVESFAVKLGVKSRPVWKDQGVSNKEFAQEFASKAIKAGYDGAFTVNADGSVVEAICYSPEQVKSASKNSGKFNPKSRDITKSSDCGANGPGGGGFQPGNTCGKEDGAGGAKGKEGKPNPKVLEWARKKFGSDEVAENFARWFGDSKVVDEDGNPLTVYHGTNAEFTEFDENRQGATDDGYLGTGFYFAPDKEWASGYGENVIDAHLSIENPLTIPWSTSWGHDSIYDVRDALAELPDMPEGLKTDREVPEGYKLYEQELEDGDWGYNPNGNNKRFYVGPTESLYGTDKEIYGKKIGSALSAIVQFNDELKGVGFADVDASGLFKDVGRDKIKAALIKSGRDGIITFDPDTKQVGEVLAFKSKQIKSASKNSGKFDPDSGDITKSAPSPKQSRKKSARKPAKGGTMRRKKGS